MAVEQARSCGFRKVGGLYLCGNGVTVGCDRLPYKIENCPICGSGLKFSRAWTWLDWYGYAGEHEDNAFAHKVCRCSPMCPVCHPAIHTPLLTPDKKVYGLLWVGEKFYSPDAFVRESMQLGISRRLPYTGNIPRVPKNLKLGETWVLFAHKHVIYTGKDEKGVDIYEPAIFHAFKPTRLELLLWQKDATKERLTELEEAGITPVIIPDGDKDHDPYSPLGLARDDKEELEDTMLFKDLRSKLGGNRSGQMERDS